MAIVKMTAQAVNQETVEALGLDPDTLDLLDPESLAALLRRTASFLCPTTERRIIDDVLKALDGIVELPDDQRSVCQDMLRNLINYGDLVELETEDDGGRKRKLYLGMPTYVRCNENRWLIIGIKPNGAPALGNQLQARIEHKQHLRYIAQSGVDDLHTEFSAAGFHKRKLSSYVQQPLPCVPKKFVADYENLLAAGMPGGSSLQIQLIDPDAPRLYYRGRWRDLASDDSGLFVGRRPQEYGSDLWCYFNVDGEVSRLIDLPALDPMSTGYDEAWRLQAAHDALLRQPQQVSVSPTNDSDDLVLNLYSPIPSWMQRRLDTVGTPLIPERGALMSYRLRCDELAKELEALDSLLWTTSTDPHEKVLAHGK